MYDDAVPDELKFWGYLFDVRYTDPNSLDAFQYLSLLFLNEVGLHQKYT